MTGLELSEVENELQALFDGVKLVEAQMRHGFANCATVDCPDHLAENPS